MAGELSLFQAGGSALSRRDARQVGSQLAALEVQGRVGLARIDQAAFLQAARVDGVAEVAAAAMDAVARVSLRGDQLAQMVPSAAGRIHAIADALTIAQIGLVHDTARRMK